MTKDRRPFWLAALVTLALGAWLLAFVAPAGAAKITTYRGTPHRDVIRTGNGGWQEAWGLGGNDSLHGGRGTDLMHGGRGNDRIWTGAGGAKEAAWGGRGNDRINDWASGESPGYLNGGPGRDVCIGDKHDTFISCEVVRWKK
jgi:Ca2+-binding RTX toxin-like protein